MSVTVHCPTCGTLVEWTAQARQRPFCSERCRMIDLGQWASEDYRIPSEDTPVDLETRLDSEPD